MVELSTVSLRNIFDSALLLNRRKPVNSYTHETDLNRPQNVTNTSNYGQEQWPGDKHSASIKHIESPSDVIGWQRTGAMGWTTV